MDLSQANEVINSNYPDLADLITSRLHERAVIRIAELCNDNSKPQHITEFFVSRVKDMDDDRQVKWVVNPFFQALIENTINQIRREAGNYTPADQTVVQKPTPVDDKDDKKVTDDKPKDDPDDDNGLFSLFD